MSRLTVIMMVRLVGDGFNNIVVVFRPENKKIAIRSRSMSLELNNIIIYVIMCRENFGYFILYTL